MKCKLIVTTFVAVAVLTATVESASAQRYAYYCYQKRGDGTRQCFAKQCRWASATQRAAAVTEIKAACKGAHGQSTRAGVKVNSGALGRCTTELAAKCTAAVKPKDDPCAAKADWTATYFAKLKRYAQRVLGGGGQSRTHTRHSKRQTTVRCPDGRRLVITTAGTVTVRKGASTYAYTDRVVASRNPFMKRRDKHRRLVGKTRVQCRGGRVAYATQHIFRDRYERIVAGKWERNGRTMTINRPRVRDAARDRQVGHFLCGSRGMTNSGAIQQNYQRIKTWVETHGGKLLDDNATPPKGWRNAGPGTRG